MAGTLYIVATPIGNLEDMPPRVAATFGAADFIAAEDTRVTMKLLNYLGLKKPMVSYYEHALQKGEAILQRIEAGESCALCSDAGMPCVSDPGEVIVRDALARGIKVVPIPAASACVTALAVSGQDTSRWVFEGFLPVNRKQKKERLAELLQEKRTVIFYEAPHKLRTTLDDLTAAFGPERSITLCRELTKLHEEIWKTTLGEAVEHYRANDPRGEYVLVMAGAPAGEDADARLTLEQAAQRALELTGEGFGPTAAAKAAAQGTPVLAAADGVVRMAGSHKSYGNYLRILHADGDETLYAHMQYLFVKAGECVTAGQILGTVGETGNATGPHLHFEILHRGLRYDPAEALQNAS